MKLLKNSIIELNIDKMAYGGQGITRLNGYVIFVKGAVPGDRVAVQVVRKKKGFAEARITELIALSTDRVEAPCPYSGYCGGCQWQHLRYEKQLAYKKEHVKESMDHLGTLKDLKVHDTVPCENRFGYRNKMEFSFSDRRWFLPQDMHRREIEERFALGLHVPGTFSKVIDIDACLLQHEGGNNILRLVKGFVKDCGIPVYGLKTHKGFWRFLAIRHSSAFDEWMVNVVTSDINPALLKELAESLNHCGLQIRTVVNNVTRRKAAIAVGESETTVLGKGYIEDRIGPFTFQISANSFFQTNSSAAEKLYQKVIDFVEPKGTETVLDLYSGTGTIPIFLSAMVHTVTGIEVSQEAVLDAQRNCKALGIDNCRFVCGDIRNTLSTITSSPDVMIIDPPRAGMHKDVLSQVLALSPKKIVYVSCNPATMARDMGLMASEYEVLEIQPVDMFPQTYHIEAVGKLSLRKR